MKMSAFVSLVALGLAFGTAAYAGPRSNKGGATRGKARAAQMHSLNAQKKHGQGHSQAPVPAPAPKPAPAPAPEAH
jgi:hypothetical protein